MPQPARKTIPMPGNPFDEPDISRSLVTTFTPSEAQQILSTRNPRNRPISEQRKRAMAEEMAAGRWLLNGETLIFDKTGMLLDGQHRLAACVAAGVPLTTWIILGMEPDVFTSIDSGSKRKMCDDLAIEHHSNTCLLAAALAIVGLDERGQLEQLGKTPSRAEGVQILARHPGLIPHVTWVASHRKGLLMPNRIAAFCSYRFAQKDADAAARFFEDLRTGAGLRKGDPVLLLRNRLIENQTSKAKLPPVEILALTIKAWNHRRSGTAIAFLRWRGDKNSNPEAFPAIA